MLIKLFVLKKKIAIFNLIDQNLKIKLDYTNKTFFICKFKIMHSFRKVRQQNVKQSKKLNHNNLQS